jgi:hypothetical protein
MILTGKLKKLGEKPVPVPLCQFVRKLFEGRQTNGLADMMIP